MKHLFRLNMLTYRGSTSRGHCKRTHQRYLSSNILKDPGYITQTYTRTTFGIITMLYSRINRGLIIIINHSEGSNNDLNNSAACSTPSAARLMDIIKKFNIDAELAVLLSFFTTLKLYVMDLCIYFIIIIVIISTISSY